MLYHRRQFGSERRETTITDEIVADLRRRGRGLLHVAPAPGPESRYGADIELWLRGGGYLLGMLLQAKSLHPRKRSDGIYGRLHHIVGRGPTARDQVDILIAATKKPLVPMYLYYNGLAKKPAVQSGCGSMNGFAKKNGRLGLTVSSADVVK
jgi:hypothetical protein